MEKVYLTLNFLFRDWHTEKGELWAVVQPHIREDSDTKAFPNLYSYIKATADPLLCSFSMWSAGLCESKQVIPVPFPDNCRVGLKLLADDDTALSSPEINDLSRFLNITNPQLFTWANREPHQTDRNTEKTEVPVPAKGPFPLAYNEQLRKAAVGLNANDKGAEGQIARLPAMLQLAFWGGSRRRLPIPCFDATSVNHNLLHLPTLAGEQRTVMTNLHSVLGLTFLVARKDGLDEAKQIAKLEIEVNGSVIGQAPPDSAVWKALFGSLDENIDDPATAISIDIDKTLVDRAYVRQAYQSFEIIRNSSYFRATRTTTVARDCTPPIAQSTAWLPPTRFVGRPIQDPPHDDMQWQAYLQFEGTLERYRRAPIAAEGSDSGRTVLRFLPLPSVQKEFSKYFKDNYTGLNGSTIWKGAVFLAEGDNPKAASAKVEALRIGVDLQDQADIYWIDAYQLPWDMYSATTEGFVQRSIQVPTLLFLGKEPAPSRVLLLFPRGKPFATSFRSDDVETHVGENRTTRASLGNRWELKDGEALPDTEFNVLRCTSGDARKIAPQLCFPGLVEFDFAQSTGAIEGIVSVNYPKFDGDSHSAEQAILQEVLNYNSLIVLQDGQRQNLFGQILPSIRAMKSTSSDPCAVPSGGGSQTFSFRFEPPTDAPPHYHVDDESVLMYLPKLYSQFLPREWNTAKVAKAFFKNLFEAMDQPRLLSFGVEHTLGTSLFPDAPIPLKAPARADFPVILPTEVVLRRDPDKQRSPDEDIPFLRISYNNETHPVTLHLHTILLEDQAGDHTAKRTEARIAACRAVAELAFAASVKIKARIYHFDYRQALRSPATQSVSGLGDCFVFEDGPEWNCTELKKHCRDWLYHDTPLPSKIVCEESARLEGSYPNLLFLEFELSVVRDANKVPPGDEDKHWKVSWKPTPPGQSDDVDRAGNNLIYAEFNHYLSTLKSRCGILPALRADDATEKLALDAAAIVGAGAGSSAGWIFRDHPTANSEVSVTICPLAFSPIARNSALGDQTYEIVTRYFERIDSFINSDPDWMTGDLAQLRKNFKERVSIASYPGPDGTQDAKSATLWNLIDVASTKVYPATKADDVVAKIATSNNALSSVLRDQVSRLLWASPRIFGDAKAFLCSLVQGGSLKQPADVPLDFVLFRTTKITHRLSRALLDNRPQPFAQTLSHDPDLNRLLFLEVLDESRYGDVFEIKSAEWENVARVLSTGADVAAGKLKDDVLWDTVTTDHLLLPNPTGAQTARSDRHVHLPSREPVVAPNHVFSGYFEELQLGHADYETIEFTGLAQGIWKTGTDLQKCLELKRLSPSLRRAQEVAKSRPDEAFFSMLYWITGDEESQKPATSLADVFQSYQNDEFLLFQRRDAWPLLQSPAPPTDSVFRTLLSTEDEQGRRSVFDSANLNRLIEMLKASSPAQEPLGLPDTASLVFKLALDKNGNPSVKCRFPHESRSGWRDLTEDDVFEISVLRRCSDVKRSGARQRLLLLITAKVDLWTPQAFRLVLHRNEHFDQHFTQQAVAGGSPYANQRSVARDFSDREPVEVKWRSNSLTGLVNDVLLRQCFPQPPQPKWNDYDLSVTVRRHHKMTWMLSGANGGETLVKRDVGNLGTPSSFSSYPLTNRKYLKGQTKAERERHVCWFEQGTDEFFVDWLWSSQTNLPFLRLSGLRVTVKKDSPGCDTGDTNK